MKKRLAFVILIAAAISLVIFFIGEGIIQAIEKQPSALPAPPDVSAQNAVVIELSSGKVLYEKNANDKAFPASITKILTALVAIEKEDLNTVVTVTDSAVGVEGSSIYLTQGEKISLKDLLYGMMLRSGNDAAVAIAVEIGGSTQRFADLMNERAKKIGTQNTHFTNPNGLQDENHYTTAKDMALIAREAMKNNAFRAVAAAKSYTADRGEGKYNYFANKNKVIYQYDGGTGIKIGFTKKAGRTLVASSKKDGMELICVVLNAPDWFNDTYRLMDYCYENIQLIQVTPGQRPINSVKIVEGSKSFAYIGTKEDVMCPTPKESECELSIVYDLPKRMQAPVKRWQEAGKLDVYCDGEFVYAQPLYYLEDIEGGN